MSPSRPFILRPVATALLMVAIVLAGLLGLKFLPLSALPQVDYPTIQVQTLYPGASPEVMAQTVTAPLERQFGQMPGLERMGSTSALASLGIAIDTLRTAIVAANANAAKGSIDGPTRSYTINSNDQLLTAQDYGNLVVAFRNGAPVHLSDVAQVVQSAENVKLGA